MTHSPWPWDISS